MNNSTTREDVILIVDDNLQNLKLLGQILETEKYDVVSATNGQDAIDYLNDEKPDLILLDVMMPDMDGFTVCKTLKENQSNKNIPIIFLTAKTDVADILKGFNVGGVDYISKPFQPAELLARVRTHLDLKRAREEIISLRGILPICANCKQIRDDDGYWNEVETYIQNCSDVKFTHSICPTCKDLLYPELRKKKQ